MVGEGANFLHKNMYKGKSLNNLLENQLPRKTLTLVNTSKDCVVLSLSESLGVGGPHWGGVLIITKGNKLDYSQYSQKPQMLQYIVHITNISHKLSDQLPN